MEEIIRNEAETNKTNRTNTQSSQSQADEPHSHLQEFVVQEEEDNDEDYSSSDDSLDIQSSPSQHTVKTISTPVDRNTSSSSTTTTSLLSSTIKPSEISSLSNNKIGREEKRKQLEASEIEKEDLLSELVDMAAALKGEASSISTHLKDQNQVIWQTHPPHISE